MAIDSDAVGMKKMDELVKYMDDGSIDFTQWELGFLTSNRHTVYDVRNWQLTSDKVKNVINELYDKRVMQVNR